MSHVFQHVGIYCTSKYILLEVLANAAPTLTLQCTASLAPRCTHMQISAHGVVEQLHLDVIRKEAWLFCRTTSGVRLCWELEEPRGPEGSHTWEGRMAASLLMLSSGEAPQPAYVHCIVRTLRLLCTGIHGS